MAPDFSTSAELELEVSRGSLRDARSTIEQELGEIEIGVSAETGGGGRQQGQLAGILDANKQQFELAVERNEYLEELVDELEDVGGMSGGGFLGGMGTRASGSMVGGLGGSAAGGALTGLLSAGSLSVGAGAAVTIGTATLIVEGLRNEDAFTRQEARKEAEAVTRAGERGQLPGSRFDSGANEPINLSEEIGEFTWPEITVDDIIMPLGRQISPLTWNVPGAAQVVDEVGRSVPRFQWQAPTSEEITSEIADAIDISIGGEFDGITVDMGDIVNNIDVDPGDIIDETVDQAVDSIENGPLANIQRRIERALNR